MVFAIHMLNLKFGPRNGGNIATYKFIGFDPVFQGKSRRLVDKNKSRLPFPVDESTMSCSDVNFDPLLVNQFQQVSTKKGQQLFGNQLQESADRQKV